MVQLTAVDAQKPCRFYHVKLLQYASSRFTTISMNTAHFLGLSQSLKRLFMHPPTNPGTCFFAICDPTLSLFLMPFPTPAFL